MDILVVDDDLDFAEGVADVLSLEGHEVTRAFNGEAAAEVWRSHPIDVCPMDLELPGMDGVEAMGVIRAVSPGAGVDAARLVVRIDALLFPAEAP